MVAYLLMSGTVSHDDNVVAKFDGQDASCLNTFSLGVQTKKLIFQIKMDSNKKRIVTSDYEYEGNFLTNRTCPRGVHSTFAILGQEDTVLLCARRHYTISRQPVFGHSSLVDSIENESKTSIRFRKFQLKKEAEVKDIRIKNATRNRKSYSQLFYHVLEEWAKDSDDAIALAELDEEERVGLLEERQRAEKRAERKTQTRLAKAGIKTAVKTKTQLLREWGEVVGEGKGFAIRGQPGNSVEHTAILKAKAKGATYLD
jgi:hypothetical protein